MVIGLWAPGCGGGAKAPLADTAPKPLTAVERAEELRQAGRFDEALQALDGLTGDEAARVRARVRWDEWEPSLGERPAGTREKLVTAPEAGDFRALVRAGQQALARDRDAAAAYLQKALPLAAKLDRTRLADRHWLAAADELYGDLLMANRHWAHARGLYAKAYAMFQHWPYQSAYTQGRRRELNEKLRAADAGIFGGRSAKK